MRTGGTANPIGRIPNNAITAAQQAATVLGSFFSGSGSSYVIGKAVNTEDEDWNF